MSQDQVQIAGVVVADATREGCPLTYVSPGFEQLTGYAAADMLGRKCSLLQGPDTDPRAVEVLRQAVAAGTEAYVTILNYRADGTPFWNEVALAPQRDPDGRVVRYLGVQKDVTARRLADARIHDLANFDTLTGLANRSAMHDELTAAVSEARLHGSQLALLFVDIDDFKRVNDRHGHQVADALLQAVAQRLRSVVRYGDVLGRPGGDEFLLLIRRRENVAQLAAELAARVVACLHEPSATAACAPLEIRASVGVSTYAGGAGTIDDLMRHADVAMYTAKNGGKDGFRVYRSPATATGHDAGADSTRGARRTSWRGSSPPRR
jgi:diguanylate cyclase (GGDEF)-like protein/PAS domain S-box-containing protein